MYVSCLKNQWNQIELCKLNRESRHLGREKKSNSWTTERILNDTQFVNFDCGFVQWRRTYETAICDTIDGGK